MLLPHQRNHVSSSSRTVILPKDVRESLEWWTSPAILRGTCFREPPRLTITTDASLFGWGAHLESHLAQGQWSELEAQRSINFLELRAIFLALQAFSTLITGQHILILTDNTTAKAHVNRMGGTHSRSLLQEAFRLDLWAEAHLASLKADHISGVTNIMADSLSRNTIDQSEWALVPSLFNDLSARFGLPQVDLFSSTYNHQLPQYFTRFPSRGVEAVDALRSPWPQGLLYAFPPLPDSQGNPQVTGAEIRADTCRPLLAQETVVRRSPGTVGSGSMEDTRLQSGASPGSHSTSRSTMALPNRLEVERIILKKAQVPTSIIPTIQAARRDSTSRIYQATWRAFVTWCEARSRSATSASVVHVLEFLHDGFKAGLSPNTLRRQLAAISSILTCGSHHSLSREPLLRDFLRGATNLRPPVVHRFPSWSLHKILSSLTRSPFEPLREAPIRYLPVDLIIPYLENLSCGIFSGGPPT
ncbi:uncharacterized protein LOC131191375 [Ahaetulla prasina]|uniref:uncharacterized protein LOC131191375 n=1 Tax=Ahaetulla prasina TaxID=499056 RepID=UPI0026481930|nr:uncharacterized protein LOC131191375 [Ahaetulla prasina]